MANGASGFSVTLKLNGGDRIIFDTGFEGKGLVVDLVAAIIVFWPIRIVEQKVDRWCEAIADADLLQQPGGDAVLDDLGHETVDRCREQCGQQDIKKCHQDQRGQEKGAAERPGSFEHPREFL